MIITNDDTAFNKQMNRLSLTTYRAFWCQAVKYGSFA